MRVIDDLEAWLRHMVWSGPAADAPWWRRWLLQGARMAYAVGGDLASGALTLRAMSLVFTSLLAFVPLLAVSFSVLKGFGAHNRVEPMLRGFLAPLGPRSDQVAAQIVGFVDNVEVAVLGVVGVALLLYTAISLVQKIEAAFNYTWNVRRRRTLVRQFADYFSVIVIGPVLVFLALGISASLRSSAVVQGLLAIEPFGSLMQFTAALTPYLLVIAAFTFFYIIIPNTRVHFRAALVGGLVGGLVWQTLGKIFAGVVVTSTNFTAIYSSFAIVLLFMVWLYLSWLVLLTGSAVAFYYQFPLYLTVGGRSGVHLSPAQTEAIGLAVVTAVVRAWLAGESAPDRGRIARDLAVPVQAVDDALGALVRAGIVAPAGSDGTAYLPARPPSETGVKAVLDAVRHRDEGKVWPRDDSGVQTEVLASIESAMAGACGELNLSDLATRAGESPESAPVVEDGAVDVDPPA